MCVHKQDMMAVESRGVRNAHIAQYSLDVKE
uniref:Uncharacterized protein n=1 Tax=Setaria viridis TaxID=4556 RepID=A0A4U6TIZ3_SETVI|nr:hypothetical protein SEVIR_8G157033v2 [Setaria viridis]